MTERKFRSPQSSPIRFDWYVIKPNRETQSAAQLVVAT